jgi:hypothetical protein
VIRTVLSAQSQDYSLNISGNNFFIRIK